MRIFVTGGNGYIGRSVITELKRRGHHVAALVRSDAASATVRALGAEAVHGSLASLDVIELAMREHDATIHLTARMTPEDVAHDAALLDLLQTIAPDDHVFAYISGSWVYGDRGDATVDEDAPVKPPQIVAWLPEHEQKALAATATGVRVVVIRAGVVYGDGGGLIGAITESAKAGPVQVIGDGTNTWPTVRVDALAELFAAVVEQPAASGIYNASAGASVPWIEIARAASRAGGGDGSIEHLTYENAAATMGPIAEAFAADLHMSSDKAHKQLGWNPHRPTVLEELSNSVVP